MQTTIEEAKAAWRRSIRAKLQAQSAAERATASAQARELLAKQEIWQSARSILFFAPLPDELDVWPLVIEALAKGKQVALPRFVTQTQNYQACGIRDAVKELQPGQFGISEPVNSCAMVPLNMLDFILVPGVGFDLQGRRLGRGRGYYDQMLAAVRGTACGVAFDEQVVSELPVAPHDAQVNCILTPTRWIEV